MLFKEWLLLNENIEANFDTYLSNLVKYAKPEEKRYLDSHPKIFAYLQDSKQAPANWLEKSIIIQVLKDKHLENFNWFSFSFGYLVSKIRIYKEDLELAIDVTKKRIDSRELPKSEIGAKGWFKIGQESKEKVEEYIKASQELSNRQERKLRKSGETLEDDKKLIQLAATDDDLKLYFLPAIGSGTAHGLPKDESEIKARKRVLCSYGKGTKWCTAVPDGDWHESYLGNNIYIIHENDKPKYQFVSCLDKGEDNHQFMDAEDDSVKELDIKYYNFLKKYASAITNCYEIKVKFGISNFLNPTISDDIKKEISGKNLAELLNVSYRNDFEKITSIIKNLNISFDVDGIFHFLWSISPLHTKDRVVNNLITKNINKLNGFEVHDLIIHSPPIGYEETYSDKTRLKTDEMIEILGYKNLMKLNSTLIISILSNSTNRLEMAKLLGKEVLNNIKILDITNWIIHAVGDIKEILDIFKPNSLKALTPANIDVIFTNEYLRSKHSQEDMEYFVKELMDMKLEFGMRSVDAILLNTKTGKDDYIERMIKILGKENVSKLWYDSIHKLFDEIFVKKGFKGQKELAELLKDYYVHPELSGGDKSDGKMADWARIDNLINKHLLGQNWRFFADIN
jgi:hypothetical protein